MIGHKMCLSVGNFDKSHWGFKSDSNPNLSHSDWRVGSGTCDCDCSTCLEIHGKDSDSEIFYIYRYTPTGRQVAKVEIILTGEEGVA